MINPSGTIKPMKTKIETQEAPQAPGLLSQAVVASGIIYVAGQIHNTADGKMVESSTEKKVHQIMKNLAAILKAAGADFSNVLKVNVYVTDISELPNLNEVYKTYFTTEPLPVREAVCVKALPLGASIEISLITSKE
jgi:2-iminobutanoate/2-iminopropanoate deaminase